MCVYVAMYVCVHIYIHACMHACMHAGMHACMHVCMYTCMHVCMYACIYVYMYACMYVCVHIYICHPPKLSQTQQSKAGLTHWTHTGQTHQTRVHSLYIYIHIYTHMCICSNAINTHNLICKYLSHMSGPGQHASGASIHHCAFRKKYPRLSLRPGPLCLPSPKHSWARIVHSPSAGPVNAPWATHDAKYGRRQI